MRRVSVFGAWFEAACDQLGVLLQEAQNLTVVALYPWLLIPVVFVITTVLCFNFVGDGLRDAADPYANM